MNNFSRPLWHRKLLVKIWPARHRLALMTKWPVIGWLFRKLLFEGDFLTFLPSEKALPKNEKIALPGVVVDHFIEKASYRFLMNACICRDASSCSNYPVDIGCLFMGEAARQVNPQLGREISVEEAKALQRRSEKAGLINLVGKNRLDKIWLGVDPVERLLTVCHCCECCCLWKMLTTVSDTIAAMVHKMDGVTVKINEACNGCGNCLQFCFLDAISIIDDKATINQEMCRGCGRCVLNCPQEVIELTFIENDYFHKCLELIGKVEERVNVAE